MWSTGDVYVPCAKSLLLTSSWPWTSSSAVFYLTTVHQGPINSYDLAVHSAHEVRRRARWAWNGRATPPMNRHSTQARILAASSVCLRFCRHTTLTSVQSHLAKGRIAHVPSVAAANIESSDRDPHKRTPSNTWDRGPTRVST